MLGPKQARLGSRHCQTQNGSRLSDTETIAITERVDVPQGFREFGGRIGESTGDLPSPNQVLGGWGTVRKSQLGGGLIVRVCADAPPFWPAEIDEALIHHDSCDPRAELRVAAKTRQVLEGS